MTSHVAYCSKELLIGTHAFNFNCFLDDSYCVFTQIRCLSVLLVRGGQEIYSFASLILIVFIKIEKNQ